MTGASECVLALGFFDGVHTAHRELLKIARKESKKRGLPFGVFTFPSAGGIKSGAPRIYTDTEKNKIFESLGVDFLVSCDFSSVSSLTPDEFTKRVLISDMKCKTAVAGFNFRFGKGASGDIETLSALMRENGGEAIICGELKMDGRTVSASFIRELISDGNMAGASALLGAPYSVFGRVERGNAVGSRLGFPTLNLPIENGRLLPRLGVYTSAVKVLGKVYPAVTNVGKCPTLGERKAHIETHLIGFRGDLYGCEAEVYLLSFLRPEIEFESEEALKTQINIDKERAIKEAGDLKWQELGLK